MTTRDFLERLVGRKAYRAIIIVFCLCGIAGIGYSAISLVRYLKAQRYEQELSDNISRVTRGGKTSIVNSQTGKTLIKNIEVDWIQEGHDSLAVFSHDKLRGYFNIHTGEVVVPAKYKHAWIFSEGLAGVVKDGMVGFINTRGEEVIPCRYPYHGNPLSEFVFKGGHCAVADSTQHIGVIDSVGQWVIAPHYKHVSVSRQFALVTTDEGFKKQLSYDGRVLSDCVIDYVQTLSYETGYVNRETGEPGTAYTMCEDFFSYSVDGRSGLMSARGEFLTAPIYSGIYALSAGTFRAQLADSYSEVIINSRGEVISRKVPHSAQY